MTRILPFLGNTPTEKVFKVIFIKARPHRGPKSGPLDPELNPLTQFHFYNRRLIYSLTNNGINEQSYEKYFTIGMATSDTKTQTITSSTTLEVEKSFKKASASVGASQTIDASWSVRDYFSLVFRYILYIDGFARADLDIKFAVW